LFSNAKTSFSKARSRFSNAKTVTCIPNHTKYETLVHQNCLAFHFKIALLILTLQ
jgi:hypothetical protein